MKLLKGGILLLSILLLPLVAKGDGTLYAGIRASHGSHFSPFPQPEYFRSAASWMSRKLPGSQPCLVWIVALYQSDGNTKPNFPKPTGGGSYPYIIFSSTDQNESYLTFFDEHNVCVWLQVEPGNADMDTLIDLVLQRYQHHPCVIGFGVDVEWNKPPEVSNGKAVTDAEAQDWLNRVKSYNPDYRLFLKHYISSKMPPTFRGDILFVDDSQQFYSLSSLVSAFKTWGAKFNPSDVGFQYGYPKDRGWWSTFDDPAETIITSLHEGISNAVSFFWVDFTVLEIYPNIPPVDAWIFF